MTIKGNVKNSLIDTSMKNEQVIINYQTGLPVKEILLSLSKLNEDGLLKIVDYISFLKTQDDNLKDIEEIQNFDDI